MKLLLTSAGIKNKTLHNALTNLLGKPTEEAKALCIPTAIYAIPNGLSHAWGFLSGTSTTPMCELGWKSMGVLELTALPSIKRDYWVSAVEEADVLLVNGGDPMFLCYWMQETGLAEMLPNLDLVYVGLSAGSMVMTPTIGEEFVEWKHPSDTAKTLGFVDFSIFPHLDHPALPHNTMETAERWAAKLDNPAYAIDDETGFLVVDDKVEILSEGNWKQLRA